MDFLLPHILLLTAHDVLMAARRLCSHQASTRFMYAPTLQHVTDSGADAETASSWDSH